MREIIVLEVGQAGISIGNEFWQQQLHEYGLN